MEEKLGKLALPASIVVSAIILASTLFIVGGSVNTNVNNSMTGLATAISGIQLKAELSGPLAATASSPVTANAASSTAQAGGAALSEQELIARLIPRGVPELYGNELKVSFDAAEQAINVLSVFDDGISLDELGANKQKYINVTTSISCEFCCGAKAIGRADGSAACGCAHSAAMRGLAKYLFKNKANQVTEESVLAELAKWKAIFFPQPTIEKALALQQSNQPVNTGTLNTLPQQVGGC